MEIITIDKFFLIRFRKNYNEKVLEKISRQLYHERFYDGFARQMPQILGKNYNFSYLKMRLWDDLDE